MCKINATDIDCHIKRKCCILPNGERMLNYLQLPLIFKYQFIFFKTPSTNYKWEVFHPLGPADEFWYQIMPGIEFSAEGITRPDHFELLLSSECHYNSVISMSRGFLSLDPKFYSLTLTAEITL